MMALGLMFGQQQGLAPAQQSARHLKLLRSQDIPTTAEYPTRFVLNS
jgi:hypothetical protein